MNRFPFPNGIGQLPCFGRGCRMLLAKRGLISNREGLGGRAGISAGIRGSGALLDDWAECRSRAGGQTANGPHGDQRPEPVEPTSHHWHHGDRGTAGHWQPPDPQTEEFLAHSHHLPFPGRAGFVLRGGGEENNSV